MLIERDKILAVIKEILVEKLDIGMPMSEISPHDGFVSTLGIDSIGLTELRYQCEEMFQIKIDDDDFIPENFSNCTVLTAFIAGRMTAHGEAGGRGD